MTRTPPGPAPRQGRPRCQSREGSGWPVSSSRPWTPADPPALATRRGSPPSPLPRPA